MKKPAPPRRWFFLMLVLSLYFLCFGGSSPLQAALDPETHKPYHLQVVLHIAKHRLLTDVFKDQVERELRDGLQAALGDMAQVEVVRDHPRLNEIREKGLQALDGWKEIADLKIHFVLINFLDDQYEVQARQYDGLTGQPSPVVRRELVPDRRFVARTAALLIALDFGLVGTVIDHSGFPVVRVAVKGGGLGVPLERWVKKGEVFALVQINQSGAGPWAYRVPWALLRVEEVLPDGVCVCRLYHRHPEPLAAGRDVLGYRCLKLGTIRGPVRLRFIDDDPRALVPRANLQIQVRRQSFEDAAKEQDTTDADGFFRAGRDRPYEHIAFVTVMDGDKERARIPVPLIDEQPVVIKYSGKEEGSTPLVLRRSLWLGRLYENLLAQADLFRRLNELAEKPEQRPAALERAKAGLQALTADIENSTHEMNALRAAMQALPEGNRPSLADGEQCLRDLREAQQQLEKFIAGLDKALKEEADPRLKELRAKVARGQLLEDEAEFGQALSLYQEVLKEQDDPKLKAHVQKLTKIWEVKSETHREVRRFIYEVWPKVEPARLKERLPEAHAALEECKRVGDTLSPLKLAKAAVAHLAKLNEQEKALNPTLNPDHARIAETILEVREGLGKLIQDVNAFVASAAR